MILILLHCIINTNLYLLNTTDNNASGSRDYGHPTIKFKKINKHDKAINVYTNHQVYAIKIENFIWEIVHIM
jgi:hypothetical protein